MSLQHYSGGMFAAFSASDTNPPEASVDMLAEGKARAAWTNAVNALTKGVELQPKLAAMAKKLSDEGHWSVRLDPVLANWSNELQKMLAMLVSIIEQSPAAQSALDTQIAAISGANSVTVGAWREFVADLKPAPVGLSGFGVWQVIATNLARVFGNPAVWAGAKEILVKLAPWVAGTVISQNAADALNTEANFVAEKGVNLDSCLEKMNAAETDAQRAAIERLCVGTNEGTTNFTLWALLGLGAGVAGVLYWQNRDRIKVQSPVKLAGFSGRKSRRRRYG